MFDHFVPLTLREGLYYPDGQIQDEVYVYGSFVQSRMYAEGVGCSDCHDPHSLGLKALGNLVCTECHRAGAPSDRFPTLASSLYDTPAHHFHQPGSAAAECVSCHMPQRTYMVVDPRRDHSFRVPEPALSIATGSPNACNGCHLDQSPEWAAAAIRRRYPDRPSPGGHFGEILAASRAGGPGSLDALIGLADDTAQPAIVRATAVELIGARGGEGARVLAGYLNHPEPWVRLSALSALGPPLPAGSPGLVVSLLGDPVRPIRTEAARLLAVAGLGPSQGNDRAAFERALAEYEAVQTSMADTPAARTNLALLRAANGDTGAAVSEYRAALAIDPGYLPASLNLATLLNQLGENPEAIRVLGDALVRAPDEGRLHYSRGLVQAEEGRLGEASESLAEAARLLPEDARLGYNHALSLQRLGRAARAEAEFLRVLALEPGNPGFLEALVILYVQQQRWAEALPYARELARLAPEDPSAGRLLGEVEARAGAGR